MKAEPTIRRSDDSLYLVFSDPQRDPEDKWDPLHTKDEHVAEERALILSADYMRGLYDPWTGGYEEDGLTVAQAVNAFLDEKDTDLAAASMETLQYDLLPLAARWGETPMNDVPLEGLEAYYRRGDVSNSTLRRRLVNVKQLFRWAYQRRMMNRHPALDLKGPTLREEEPPVFLSHQEYNHLEAYIEEKAHDYDSWETLLSCVQLAVATGFQRRTVIEIGWDDINKARTRFEVPADKTTGQGYSVPLFTKAQGVLKRCHALYGRHEPTLIRTPRNKTVDGGWLSRTFTEAREDVGLPEGVTFRTLRDTFASWLVQADTPLLRVSGWLGHQSLETTQVYAYLAPDDQRHIADQVLA